MSRALQSSAGLGTGALIYGIGIGGLFGLVFAIAYGRLGTLTAWYAALLALLGFVSIYLVPLLKYPPNPPSVGLSDTIGRRTLLYLVIVVVSVLAMIGAVVYVGGLVPRFGEWNATLLAAGYVAVAMVLPPALPGVNEVPRRRSRV